jgi:hypothetical protein
MSAAQQQTAAPLGPANPLSIDPALLEGLNDRQLKFVQELLLNGGNGGLAYRRAYPDCKSNTTAIAAAARLKAHPVVQRVLRAAEQRAREAVVKAVERYGITADAIADEMARLAFSELRQVCDWWSGRRKDGTVIQHMRVRDSCEIDPDAHKALRRIKREQNGSLSVELYDKQAALMDLARLRGWVADRPSDQNQVVMLRIER